MPCRASQIGLSCAALGAIAALTACAIKGPSDAMIQTREFGQTPDGHKVTLYTLANRNGLRAQLIDYGAILVRLETPDRSGKLGNVLLGFDRLGGYLERHPYFGATVGRFANRIAKGRFTLDGQEHALVANNGPNHLHGGTAGFDKAMWKAEARQTPHGGALRFSYRSRDGEEGYPGNLDVEVTYTLTHDDALEIAYEARADKATPVNLTHHSYFNLAGASSGSILGHELELASKEYLPTDDTLIPTGEIAAVAGTPLDFTTAHRIGERIGQIQGGHFAGGYDHCFVLDRAGRRALTSVAKVVERGSGRVMEVLTTEPGIQLYTGNFLDGTLGGADGVVYRKHQGFCLEAQHFPDSVNKPHFPSPILRPGETYKQVTVYRFSVVK